MSVRYNEDFKLEVVKAYMAGDRSTAELSAEYNVAKSTILDWAKKYSDVNATIKIPHLKILKLMLLRRLED